MIDVYFYGQLRRFAEQQSTNSDSVIHLSYVPDEKLIDLISRIGFTRDEVTTMFINHHLANLNDAIPRDESRIAFFGKGMDLIDGGLYLAVDDLCDRACCVKCFD